MINQVEYWGVPGDDRILFWVAGEFYRHTFQAMNDMNSRSDRQVLLMSTAGNLVIGMVGIFFAFFSRSLVILLDALFKRTYHSERFPLG